MSGKGATAFLKTAALPLSTFTEDDPFSRTAGPTNTSSRFSFRFFGGRASPTTNKTAQPQNKLNHSSFLPPSDPSPSDSPSPADSMLLANNNGLNFHHIAPSSPTPSHYSTPPTSRKRFCFGGGNGAINGNESPRSSGLFMLQNEREAHSPPPLSSFYDTPIDGSLTVAEEPETNNLFSDYRRDGGFMTNKKRGFSETLEENEYYENGRAGPGGAGIVRKDADERASKRRIIEMVGSVASKVWEICKVSTTGILSFPGALLGAAAGEGGTEIREKSINEFGGSDNNHGIDGIYENPTTPLAEEAGLYHYVYNAPPSRGNSLDLPNDADPLVPAMKRRTSSHSSRGHSPSPVRGSDGGIRAQWVFVPPHESQPSHRARPTSSRSHISRRSTGKPVGHIRTGSGTVTASSSSYGGKRRPFRFPVKTVSPTTNVMFEYGNSSSGSGVSSTSPRRMKRSNHRRTSTFAMEEDDDDEVDESIKRFNEQLKAMIREGKEALGSKVEVVYDDDHVEVY